MRRTNQAQAWWRLRVDPVPQPVGQPVQLRACDTLEKGTE